MRLYFREDDLISSISKRLIELLRAILHELSELFT